MTWVEETYPGYKDVVARSTFSNDAYTGEARDKAQRAANRMEGSNNSTIVHPEEKLPVLYDTQRHGVYLRRRAQGEHIENYKERVAITRFPLHMQAIVSGYVGSLSEVEKNWVRNWGILGDKDQSDSLMYSLWRDCDGEGTNWNVKMNEAAVDLIVDHDVWYGMLPPSEAGMLPQFVLFDLPRVRNFRKEGGRLVEAIISDDVQPRTSLKSPAADPETQYIHYTLQGWTRYRVEDDNVTKVDSDEWSKEIVGRRGKPRLPIGRIVLPLKYHVGYRVAQGNIDLYNLFSDTRNLLRVANHPTLRGKDMTEKQFSATIEQRTKGSNVMFGDWAYISPESSNAEAGYKIYKEEVRDFYITSLQQYQDSPKAVTARQVEEDSKSRTAFQSLLSEALDEIENDVLFLTSQILSPNTMSRWGDATVERSKEFRPIDEFLRLSGLVDHTFPGGRVPADVDTALDVAVKYYEDQGVSISPERRDAIRLAIQDVFDRDVTGRSLEEDFNIDNLAA